MMPEQVERKIEEVEKKVDEVELQIKENYAMLCKIEQDDESSPTEYLFSGLEFYRQGKTDLRQEKADLRQEEADLRQKEADLRRKEVEEGHAQLTVTWLQKRTRNGLLGLQVLDKQ